MNFRTLKYLFSIDFMFYSFINHYTTNQPSTIILPQTEERKFNKPNL